MDYAFDIPFARLLGIELLRCDGGRCELRCELAPHHCNSMGVAHGGLTMSMLDLAMSLACSSTTPDQARCSTVEMKTAFLRPAGSGTLRALAEVVQTGGRLIFCEAHLLGGDGRQVARASGTFNRQRGAPTTGAAPSAE